MSNTVPLVNIAQFYIITLTTLQYFIAKIEHF